MAGRRIGEVFVAVEADTSMFRTQAFTGVKKALTGIEGRIPIRADTAEARAQIAALKARMTDLNKQLAEIKIGVNGKPAEGEIRKLQLELKKIADIVAKVTMDADTSRLDAKIAREFATLRKLQEQSSNLVMDAEDKRLIFKIADLQRRILKLRADIEDPESIDFDDDLAKKKLASMRADLKVLRDEARRITMDASAASLIKAIVASRAEIEKLKAEAADIKLGGKADLTTLATAEGRLVLLEGAAKRLNPELDVLNTKLIQGANGFGRFGLGALGARIALFGGLRFVTGWHVALDTIVESLAVIVPALITAAAGLAAFGVAGVDAARQVYQRLLNIHTVADATGKTIAPLTGNLEKLHATVRPQVWQLYGDAIAVAGHHTDLFNRLATSTGGVIDRFAARITILATSGGNGLANFFKVGAKDLEEFGRIARSLGDAFGKLIQVTQETHIAETLLNIVGAAARLFDVFTKLPLPILATVIAVHGIYLWSGLAASALTALLRPFGRMAAAAAGTKAAGTAVEELAAAGGGTRFSRLGATFADLATNLTAIPGRAKAAALWVGRFLISPWGLITVGVVALIGLGVWLSRTKSRAQELVGAIDQLGKTATVFNVINVVGQQLALTNKGLATAQRDLNARLKEGTFLAPAMAARFGQLGSGAQEAADRTTALTGKQTELVGTLTTVTGRLAGVAAQYGTKGLTGAMALAAVAGVKVNQLLGDTKSWAVAKQQIDGVVQGYANMGQGATQLGNDINVLTIAQSDQLKNITSLNNAFDNFTKIVSGPISGFLSFANTLKRFGNDAGVAGARMTGLGAGFTGVSHKVTDASLQLQTDFQDTFNSATQMADAFRLTGEASNKQVGAIKNWVQILIPMAGSNKAAAAEISALAQEAGGPATTNLQTLAKWAGKTKDPLAAAQKAANDAAIGFSNMSEDAQKLGTTLSQDLTKDMAAAVENAVGLQGAMNKFALDLQHGTDVTAAGHKDRQTLRNDLAEVGITGKPADAIINAMTDRLSAHRKALQASEKARALFNNDLNAVVRITPNAAGDVQKMADAIKNHGAKSDAAKGARKKLIDDLIASGVSAKDAKRLVDNLQTSISGMHGKSVKVGVNFVGSGTGSIAFKESIPGVSLGPSSGGLLGFHAAGGMISGGTPGKDSVLGMLMPGEVVVPTRMVKAGAVDHLRGQLPGFASGGQVGQAGVNSIVGTGNTMVGSGTKFMEHAEAQFGKAVEAAFAKAVIAKFNKDMNALAGNGSAIVRYARSWLNKIPYVFGGTSFSGDDCSGFTQAVYGKFGIQAPRTSEAQMSWATKSGPVPGALAFYVSPGGGPPPGHVAIVQDGSSVISQGGPQGVKGPKIQSLHFLPLMGTGVPKGGFPGGGTGGSGNAAISSGGPANLGAAAAQRYAAGLVPGNQMKFLIELWNRESGWNRFARNASSGAYGIPQALPPGKMGAAANPPTSSAAAQINWGLSYIRGRYGTPQNAWAHELSWGWYGAGGMIPGYAAGGTAPLRSALAREEASERAKYAGLVHAYASGPAKDRPLSVRNELQTLSKRQAAELGAYAGLSGAGLTTSHLHHLAATARAEFSTASDKGLNKAHPGWAADLRKYLQQINVTASGSVPAGGTGGGGGGGPSDLPSGKQLKFWLGAAQYGELVKYRGLVDSFMHGPSKYRTKTVLGELRTLAARQASEAAAYKAVLSGTMTKAELTHLGAVARSEYSTANDQGLNKLPGGHPGFAKDLRTYLAQLSRLTGTLIPGSGVGPGGGGPGSGGGKPAGPPLPKITHTYGGDIANNLGAFISSVAPFLNGGMVQTYDQGGWLRPGLTMAYNGTGRNEAVSATGGGTITFEVTPSGNAFDAFLISWLKKNVKIKGGGSVQKAWGSH